MPSPERRQEDGRKGRADRSAAGARSIPLSPRAGMLHGAGRRRIQRRPASRRGEGGSPCRGRGWRWGRHREGRTWRNGAIISHREAAARALQRGRGAAEAGAGGLPSLIPRARTGSVCSLLQLPSLFPLHLFLATPKIPSFMPRAACSEAEAYTTGRGGCASGGAGLPQGPLCVWRGCARARVRAPLLLPVPPCLPPAADPASLPPLPCLSPLQSRQQPARRSKMSGQTLTDRIAAAQYSVTGSAVARAVCKATTHEVMGPKKKHLDCEHPFLFPQARPGAEDPARRAL